MRIGNLCVLCCYALILAGVFVGCSDGGNNDSSYGSAINSDYKIEELECDGPNSLSFSQGGITIDVAMMSPCAEAHSPQVTLVDELPERMKLASYEQNITRGTQAFDIELGLRDFSHGNLEAAVLKLQFDKALIPFGIHGSENVLARIYDLDDDTVFDLVGKITADSLVITTPGLPNRFYAAVIYNPNMRSLASNEIPNGSWSVRRWCVLYDIQQPTLVQSAALLYGVNDPSEEQKTNAVRALILEDMELASADASQKNFAPPAGSIADSPEESCSELGLEPRYILAYELINRDVLPQPGVTMLSLANYTFGVFYLKSQLLASVSNDQDKSMALRAFPSPVNNQVTDSVTQVNTKVIGDAPAMAMGSIYQAMSHAISNAAQNAIYAQQQASVTMQAATTMGVTTLYSIDTANTGIAKESILSLKLQLPASTLKVETSDDVFHLADDTFYLDSWLLTSSAPRSNQDFFSYVGKRYNQESLAYLIPLLQEINVAVENSANTAEIPGRRAGMLFEPELETVRVAINNFFLRNFGVGLGDAYLDFIVARAVTHGADSVLRDGEVTQGFASGLFHSNLANPDKSSLVEIGFDGTNFTSSKGIFVNIAPFAARAIFIPAKVINESGVNTLHIELRSATGLIGDTVQGAVCQGKICSPLTEDILISELGKGTTEDIVVLIANLQLEGMNEVSFFIGASAEN